MLSLDDVIKNALPECVRFRNMNYKNNKNLIQLKYGFGYIKSDPDTTLDEFIKIVLKNAGLL